jgi:hypothetical protein
VYKIRETSNAHSILLRKPSGKRPCGRLRKGSEDNIKMDDTKLGFEDGR